MGAITAPALLAAWIAVYAFGWSFPHRFPLRHWHSHEMLFGFAGAMMAGFLLTAPGNWTGRPMPRGPRLGALAMLWLFGRAAGFFPRLIPGWLAMVVDVAFPLALAGVLVWALRGLPRQRHNLIFPALLLAMAAVSGMSHLQLRAPNGAALGTELMLYLILWVIAVMGGTPCHPRRAAECAPYQEFVSLHFRTWYQELTKSGKAAKLLSLFFSEVVAPATWPP